MYGEDWLEESYKYIQEDRKRDLRYQMLLMPLARTPMDKKSGRAMKDYSKRLEGMIDDLAPWQKGRKAGAIRRKFGDQMGEDQQVVVMLGSGDDPNNPLFKDANIKKSK